MRKRQAIRRKDTARIQMGKYKDRYVEIPKWDSYVECLGNGESLMLYGNYAYKGYKYRQFSGIGIVYGIAKGDICDFVRIQFGVHNDSTHYRTICIYKSMARRQILTLKRGQPCQVYGVVIYKKKEYVDDKGETQTRYEEILYAKGLNGWYVPTLKDTRSMERNEHIVNPSAFEESIARENQDILDMFTNNEDLK